MRNITFAVAAVMAAYASPAFADNARIEVHGGAERLQNQSTKDTAVTYGGSLGYDVNLGESLFAGVEVSGDDTAKDSCKVGATARGRALCSNAQRDLSAILRLGINIDKDAKLYVLGGYSNARFDLTRAAGGNTTTSIAKNYDGFRAGAGFQYNVTTNVYAKIEYRYSNYQAGLSRHQALVGLGLSF